MVILREEGKTLAEIGDRLAVSHSAVLRCLSRYRSTHQGNGAVDHVVRQDSWIDPLGELL